MTGVLREMGFETRNLGPVQMTTDTAVMVARMVLIDKKPLDSIKFVDRPEIKIGKKDFVMLPFRFVADQDGNPITAPGLLEHLKDQNNESLDFN
jgi:ribosome biogenesis SPOUT family RNA methylase Rps3